MTKGNIEAIDSDINEAINRIDSAKGHLGEWNFHHRRKAFEDLDAATSELRRALNNLRTVAI